VVTEATNGLGFEPRLQFDGAVETMYVHIADHLVPVVREALSNVARHVRVGISDRRRHPHGVRRRHRRPAEVLGGRGLSNMAARARDLGGEFTITPQPSGGSLLTWQVPQRSPQPA
jgi:signal transduction histidine kinase